MTFTNLQTDGLVIETDVNLERRKKKFVVHIERIGIVRRVAGVLPVDRYDAANDEYELTQI